MEKTLGQRIRELREARDLSLREFAKRLGATPAHVSDIELGRRNPSDDLLEKIATLLEDTVEELRKYDRRAPIEELRKLIALDPNYGFALRTLAGKDISADEIIKWTSKKPDRDRDK
jgi:transcriptional regulator with XRE-family HTH domain